VDEQTEPWELRSGTWHRDRVSGTWRLAATEDGAAVDRRIPEQDVARLIGVSREPASGECFPPDFNYSPRSGAPLAVNIPALESTWVPPFGASALSGAKPLARGLRQTPLPLALARVHERSESAPPDRTLPLPSSGQYRFVVDKFGAACPTLMAAEPERGELFVLLPESKRWTALGRTAGASWGQRLRDPLGWRMEIVPAPGRSTAFCPSDNGLAALSPHALGLGYAVEHAGEGPAVGGPVAWRGEVWAPVLGRGHVVQLVSRPFGADWHIVLPTRAPVPRHGFQAPVFDEQHVNWPCEEGQLVLRLDADGEKGCDWIPWPDRTEPLFAMGCPYLSLTGTFWQLCRRSDDGRFEYLEMASAAPQVAPIGAPCLSTGRACYRGTLRLKGDPWGSEEERDAAPAALVVPLLESTHDGAVVGLRLDAPHGVPALLHAGNKPRSAVLQIEVQGRGAVPFGRLDVRSPWLALPFVHDGHLWVNHPDLPQALGWELGL